MEELEDIASIRIIFPKLNKLVSRNVFGEYIDGTVHNIKIDLQVVKEFKLTDLPKIISVAPENCTISCLSFDGIYLWDFPNLIGMSSLHSKASQQSDDEA